MSSPKRFSFVVACIFVMLAIALFALLELQAIQASEQVGLNVAGNDVPHWDRSKPAPLPWVEPYYGQN